jgi:hypothetical protein
MTPSVRSSHASDLPLTMPPPAAASGLSSIRSALAQTTRSGSPAALCVSTPGPSGRSVSAPASAAAGAGSGSADGSV